MRQQIAGAGACTRSASTEDAPANCCCRGVCTKSILSKDGAPASGWCVGMYTGCPLAPLSLLCIWGLPLGEQRGQNATDIGYCYQSVAGQQQAVTMAGDGALRPFTRCHCCCRHCCCRHCCYRGCPAAAGPAAAFGAARATAGSHTSGSGSSAKGYGGDGRGTSLGAAAWGLPKGGGGAAVPPPPPPLPPGSGQGLGLKRAGAQAWDDFVPAEAALGRGADGRRGAAVAGRSASGQGLASPSGAGQPRPATPGTHVCVHACVSVRMFGCVDVCGCFQGIQ